MSAVPPGARGAGSWSQARWLLLIVLLGIALRVPALGRSLWLDEIFSVKTATLAPGALLEQVREIDAHPPGYYLLLSAWRHVLPGDLGARLLSLLLGVLLIPLAAALARSLAGPGPWAGRAALAAALLAAVTRGVAWTAWEVRSFALLALLLGLAWWGTIHALRGARPLPALVGATLALAAALYTHYYAVVGAVALLAFTWALPAPPRRKLAVLVAGAAAGLLFLPWVPVLLEQSARVREATAAGSAALPFTPRALLGRWLGVHLVESAPWGSLAAGSALLLAAGAWALRRRRPPAPALSVPAAPAADDGPGAVAMLRALTALVVGYLLAVLAFGLAGGFVLQRYAGFLTLIWCVVAGLVFTRRPPAGTRAARLVPWARALLPALVVGALIHTAVRAFSAEREDWRGAAACVVARLPSGARVGAWPGWSVDCLLHYLPEGRHEVLPLGGPAQSPLTAEDLPTIDARLLDGPRLCVVFSGRENRDGPAGGPLLLRRHLAERGYTLTERCVPSEGLAVELWSR